jgi:hypothetical protein
MTIASGRSAKIGSPGDVIDAGVDHRRGVDQGDTGVGPSIASGSQT